MTSTSRLTHGLRSVFGRLGARVRVATPRERLMLAALAAVGITLMFSVGLRLTRDNLVRWRELSARRERTELILTQAPDIDRLLAEKASSLAARRRTPAELLAELETLAREASLTASASTPVSKTSGKLTLHRIRLSLRADSLRKITDFDARLRTTPIGVESLDIEARSDAGELSATYDLVSCQLPE